MSKSWFPLESNPEVMTSYAAKLGLDTSENGLWFHDVLSTEDWAIDMVPKPVLAVLMLYPIKPHVEDHNKNQHEHVTKNGQHLSPNVFFIKQTVGNACGTIAILHAIINAKANALTHIASGSFIDKFTTETSHMNADERAAALEKDASIETFHEEAASTGQSHTTHDVIEHFITFTVVDGHLYELDGRKAFPINHGECSADDLLAHACKEIKGFMDRDADEVKFTIVALGKAGSIEDE